MIEFLEWDLQKENNSKYPGYNSDCEISEPKNKNYNIMFEFKDYKDYKQQLYELWEEGYINEVEEFLILDKETVDKDGFKQIKYRLYTEQEFDEKYGK